MPSFRFNAARLVLALACTWAPAFAAAAVIQVLPGTNALQNAATNATSGDVLELVDGTYAGAVDIAGKHLTIRARAGTTPLVPDDVQLSTAHRLVLQGLSFSQGVQVSTGNAGATLVVLQSTFKDAVIQCNGQKCIAVGNRFDPQSYVSVSSQINSIGGTNTAESVFAGNEMQSRAYPLHNGGSSLAYWNFNGGSTHIIGNRFRLDAIGTAHQNAGNSHFRIERGVVNLLGNRFEMFLDTPHSANDVYTPGMVRVGNATVVIRNNAFTLESVSGISQGTIGYRVSVLRAIHVVDTGGEVSIQNNVFDYRNVDFGASLNPAQGAVFVERHVQAIEGNTFLGIGNGAVEVAAGAFATISNNLCHQVGSACPGTSAITANPLFVNAAAGDYHLQAGSPAIDAGPVSPYLVDIDGSRNDIGVHGGSFDLDQFDVQRGPGLLPFVYPLFEANKAIDGNGRLQIRLIGVARNQ